MALAPYFARAALAAAQVIAGYDPDVFEARLTEQPVGLSMSSSGCRTREGRAIADLAVRLLARLYPVLDLRIADDGLASDLAALARRINPLVDFAADAPIGIVVGEGARRFERSVFAGSNGWIARVGAQAPYPVGDSLHAFGAGAAACLAAANLFRLVFLPPELYAADTDASLNTWALDSGDSPGGPAHALDVPRGTLIGLGAVGHGVGWALCNSAVTGSITLIDHEALDLGNVQRYVLAELDHVGNMKVDVMAGAMRASLTVDACAETFEAFVDRVGHSVDLAIVALDSAASRRAVAASLPWRVVNAWTQPGDLGVSVHGAFGGAGACLECMYVAEGRTPNEDELVAAALKIPEEVRTVRQLLVDGSAVPAPILDLIADHLRIERTRIRSFSGRPIRDLYVQGLCGGALVPIATLGGTRPEVHVPLAHQSSLAGVLLAAAAVREANDGPGATTTVTRLNVLAGVASVPRQPMAARRQGCICRDRDYVDRFRTKWSGQDQVASDGLGAVGPSRVPSEGPAKDRRESA